MGARPKFFYLTQAESEPPTFVFEKKGSEKGRTQYINEQVISKYLLKDKKPGITYVAMFDYGKFDPANLKQNDGNGIDGIRIAFHKKNVKDVIPVAKTVLSKGYKLYIQPMIIMRYTDAEILELLNLVNTELSDATAFYIVDSFGEMRANDLNRIAHLVDNNLLPDISMGFHSHNNIQLSYSNAIALLQFYTDRDLIIDSSVLGMGKGAGNLNTELFLEHLNLFYNKNYKIAPLLEIIDKILNTIRSESYWGYSIEYYLSSVNHCTPSYASHFYKKHMLPVERIAELLSLIAEEKKISFDKEYAEQLYLSYNARRHRDDDPVIQHLTKDIYGKTVLLLAPGKRLLDKKDEIETIMRDPHVITISLNNTLFNNMDYMLITRTELLESTKKEGRKIITTTSITDEASMDNYLVLDYEKWVTVENGIQDSSGIIALKLMSACGAKEILLAGFDGFSADINANYFDKNMRRPVSDIEAKNRNAYFKAYVTKLRNSTSVRFLTDSLYEN